MLARWSNLVTRVVVGELIASTRYGGMFSLLPSPPTTLPEYLTRFALGECSGVGRGARSHDDEAGDDSVERDDSEGA